VVVDANVDVNGDGDVLDPVRKKPSPSPSPSPSRSTSTLAGTIPYPRDPV